MKTRTGPIVFSSLKNQRRFFARLKIRSRHGALIAEFSSEDLSFCLAWTVQNKRLANQLATTCSKEVGRMKVVEVMTRNPLSVLPSETVGKVEELMAEHSIRQIPVIEGRELVGIVTDRDVRAHVSRSLGESPEAYEKARRTLVRDLMTTDPTLLGPDDDLRGAIELLIEEKFGAIPVVDEAEGLVGIVSYVDVLRCFLDRLEED
ncbi:MAG: CBS domain-containing protein [Deltaproteobacteria bacterium]|nr:CBS domain-containing protein [Deltaproteobacteria bacterium]